MKTEEIVIRDPYILPYRGNYYLYGTRSESCWGQMDGFDCYVSRDREEWEGPVEIFHRPAGFFADRCYWAPECVYYDGAFFLFATLAGETRKKGIFALKAEKPDGPFGLAGGQLTPEGWTCIDGTLFVQGGEPWLIFSHSFEDTPDGDMCAMPLAENLQEPAGEPIKLFSAKEAPWAKPVPFAKEEFGMDGDVYFTDGPSVIEEGGKLYMTWSSWADHGYAVGVAVSESGGIRGPWRQQEEPLFPENGGHGMLFREEDGSLRFVLHYPNDKGKEHPLICRVEAADGTLKLV